MIQLNIYIMFNGKINKFNFILSIIIITIVIWVWWIEFRTLKLPCVLFDDIKANNLKTGDIILFRALDHHLAFSMMCYYTHVGIVYIDPHDPHGTPYLLEALNTDGVWLHANQSTSGIMLSILEERIKRYKGFIVYVELREHLPLSVIDNFTNFIIYAKIHFTYNKNIVRSSIYKLLVNSECTINTNCAEFVVLCLIKLGILPVKESYTHINHLYYLSHNLGDTHLSKKMIKFHQIIEPTIIDKVI